MNQRCGSGGVCSGATFPPADHHQLNLGGGDVLLWGFGFGFGAGGGVVQSQAESALV